MAIKLTKVVLDTSAIVASSRDLKSPAFESVLANARGLGYELVVPEVVLAELVNRFRREIENQIANGRNAISEIERATGYVFQETLTDEVARLAVHDYKTRITQRFTQAGAAILEYPQVDHKTLVELDIAGRRPFSEKRQSYRDSLIWFGMVEALKYGARKLFFVTGDFAAFASSSSAPYRLHTELAEQLVRHNVKPDCIELFGSLEDFHRVVIVPLLEKAEAFLPALQEGRFGDLNLVNEVRKRIDAGLNTLIPRMNPLVLSVPSPVVGILHGGISDLELSEHQIQRITDTELWVSLHAHFTTELTVIADPDSRVASQAPTTVRLAPDSAIAYLTRPGHSVVELIVSTDPPEVKEVKIVLMQIGKWAIGNTNLTDSEFFEMAASTAAGYGDFDEERWLESTGF